jgi:hypothetical protein
MKYSTKKTSGVVALLVLSLVALSCQPLWAAEDPCQESGVFVANISTVHLWYQRAGGNCTFWNKNAIITLRPQEEVDIFSDLACEMKFCPETLKYENVRAADTAGNCRAKLRFGCSLTDM